MDLRTLGHTGMRVSPLCLGAMMFGAWGNPDHDDCVRIVHAALDAGINFIDTADVYSGGESEEIVAKALAGGRRDNVVLATKVHAPMGADPNMTGNSRRWIMREVEIEPAPAADRLDRPLPDPPARPHLRHRRHPGRAVRPRAPGQGPGHRLLDVPGRPHRRGPVGGRTARARALRVRAAPVLDPGPGRRVRRPARPASATAWASSCGARSTAGGSPAATARTPPCPRGAGPAGCPTGSRPSRPQVAAKLEAIEALVDVADEAGVPLTHLALAFVLTHPAVTSAIIGPRTMEQMTGTLGAVDVALSDETLDRIDAVVAPGTTLDPDRRRVDAAARWPTPGADAVPSPPGRRALSRPADRATAEPEDADHAETASMSIEEATAPLTAPGQMFEMEEVEIRGVPTRVWKNCPGQPARRPRALARPRRHRLPRLRGRAHHLRGALPHRRRHRPGAAATASASRRATGWPSPCATCPSGPWPSGARRRPAGWSCPSTPGGPAPSSTTGCTTRERPWPSSTPRASTACAPTSPSSPTCGPWSSPTRTGRPVPTLPGVAGAGGPLRRAGRRRPTGATSTLPDVDHRARGRRHHLLHLGHDGEAQGCGGHPPQHGHQPDEPVLPQRPGRAALAGASGPGDDAGGRPQRLPALGAALPRHGMPLDPGGQHGGRATSS